MSPEICLRASPCGGISHRPSPLFVFLSFLYRILFVWFLSHCGQFHCLLQLDERKEGKKASGMLSVIVLLVVSLTASSFAAPMRGVLNDAYNYSEDLAQYFSRVSRHIDAANGNRKPICDASNISLPSSTLPIPTNLKIRYVAVGRGTQVSFVNLAILFLFL